jgi:hypothetical protein
MGLRAIGDRVRQLFSRQKPLPPRGTPTTIEVRSDGELKAHSEVIVGGYTYRLTKLVRAGKGFVYEGSLLRDRRRQ